MVLLTFLSLGFYTLFLGGEALGKAELGQFVLVTLLGVWASRRSSRSSARWPHARAMALV